MLESGINKVPFIGSRTGGIAEFIEENINGFLFEPGNEIDLAKKIEYILTNQEDTYLAAENL